MGIGIREIVTRFWTIVSEFRHLEALAKKVPEGNLLDLSFEFRSIAQMGEAMLIDGVSTTEINAFMVEQVGAELSQPRKILGYFSIQNIPGM